MAKGKKDKGQMKFMSGKDLFTYNPDLFADDEGAAAEIIFEEDEEEKKEDDDVKRIDNETTNASASASAAAAANNDVEEVKVDENLFEDAQGADDDVDFD